MDRVSPVLFAYCTWILMIEPALTCARRREDDQAFCLFGDILREVDFQPARRLDALFFLLSLAICWGVWRAVISMEVEQAQRRVLLSAVGRGDLSFVQALLANGVDAVHVQSDEWSPLCLASATGHVPVVQALLAAGVDVNQADRNGWSPLRLASLTGSLPVVQALLEAKADVEVVDKDGASVMHVAAYLGRYDVVRTLLAAGAGVDHVEQKSGRSPLHLVASTGKSPGAQGLLDYIADADLTSMGVGSAEEYIGVARTLLQEGANVNKVDRGGRSPLHLAASVGSLSMVRALLDEMADVAVVDSNGVSAMDLAACEGHHDVVRTMVQHGWLVNAATASGSTALHRAVGWNDVEMINTLLQVGADPSQVALNGWSPLHLAAYKGHLSAVNTLLAWNPDIYLRSRHDAHSAMDVAALTRHVDVLKAMIQHGADVNAVDDSHGCTSLHFAAAGNPPVLAAAVLECWEGVARHVPQAPADSYKEVMLVLLDNGAAVNAANNIGQVPLHVAVQKTGINGIVACVDILLRRGADETAVDTFGNTAAAMVGMVGFALAKQDGVQEEIKWVRQLLANAPKDRAWRRRGMWALYHAYPDRARLVTDTGTEAVGVPSGDALGGLPLAWTAAKLLGLQNYDVFRSIVEYL